MGFCHPNAQLLVMRYRFFSAYGQARGPVSR